MKFEAEKVQEQEHTNNNNNQTFAPPVVQPTSC